MNRIHGNNKHMTSMQSHSPGKDHCWEGSSGWVRQVKDVCELWVRYIYWVGVRAPDEQELTVFSVSP